MDNVMQPSQNAWVGVWLDVGVDVTVCGCGYRCVHAPVVNAPSVAQYASIVSYSNTRRQVDRRAYSVVCYISEDANPQVEIFVTSALSLPLALSVVSVDRSPEAVVK